MAAVRADDTTAAGAWPGAPTRRFTAAGVAVALVLVAGAALWWWSCTGAHLDPGGNAGSTVSVVGAPIYVRYDLVVEGGTMTVDEVHLAAAPAGLTAEFSITDAECQLGMLASLPASCDPQPVAGQVVHPGDARVLVAAFTLTTPGAVHAGPVTVTYHDGLHRRSTNLRQIFCLSTAEAAAGCADVSDGS
jgi:hypothetical protein